jgi:hypothetical protein
MKLKERRIILKWVLGTYHLRVLIGFISLGIEIDGGLL